MRDMKDHQRKNHMLITLALMLFEEISDTHRTDRLMDNRHPVIPIAHIESMAQVSLKHNIQESTSYDHNISP